MSEQSSNKKNAKSIVNNQSSLNNVMLAKNYPTDWQDQMKQIIGGMLKYDIKIDDERTAEILQSRLDSLDDLDKQLLSLENQLVELRENRQQQRRELWGLGISVRRAATGIYGNNSLVYESLGGKRVSEYKRSGKTSTKAKTEKP